MIRSYLLPARGPNRIANHAILCFQPCPFYDMIRIMKSKTTLLSTLMLLCGVCTGYASECIGDGCNIEPINMRVGTHAPTPLGAPEYIAAQTPHAGSMAYGAMIPTTVSAPMGMMPRPIALVPMSGDAIGRPWDGTFGTFQPRKFDKTVDWRDGIPIWDDSIISYKDKDFSDWYSPMDVYYYSNTADFVTRDAVENLLMPRRPSENLWIESENTLGAIPAPVVPDTRNTHVQPASVPETGCTTVVTTTQTCTTSTTPSTTAVQTSGTQTPTPCPVEPEPVPLPAVAPVVQPIPVLVADGCPFETDAECAIWRRKPMVRENVSPRSPRVRAAKMDEFINVARCDMALRADNPVAAPLLDRYKTLMRASRACCTDGMTNALRDAGASDGLIYKFLSDDANFYNIGARCLMTTDAELDTKYPNTATAAVAADVRNGCLCRNRQLFESMLAPFKTVYDTIPDFQDAKFYYTYTDGVGRQITVSVNNDIKNVLNQLALCP